jgi:hypothetical protein
MRTLWKMLCLLASHMILISLNANSQCAGTFQSITYDTSATGTANSPYVFTMPQFNPSLGTLLAAKINSNISLNYGFTLKNVEAVNRNFSVSVGRYDQISSAALSSPFSNLVTTSLGNYPLAPGGSVTEPSSTILLNYNALDDSITNSVAPFLGGSNISFNYLPITYTNLTGSNTYYYSATANDTVHFSVTYYYCGVGVLASELLSFNAEKQNEGLVKLSWTVANQQTGTQYQLQVGTDSMTLSPAASLESVVNQNSYSYNYSVPSNASNRIYFRLKIVEPTGVVKYSAIKMVGFANTSNNPYVYPNPAASFINLVFNDLAHPEWDTWIYTAGGALVQKNHYSKTSTAHIDFVNNLAAGAYFIKLQNTTTNRQYLLSFIVQ